jgi:hypothetical protein
MLIVGREVIDRREICREFSSCAQVLPNLNWQQHPLRASESPAGELGKNER